MKIPARELSAMRNSIDYEHAKLAYTKDFVVEVINALSGRQFPPERVADATFMLADSFRRIGLLSSAISLIETLQPLLIDPSSFDLHLCLAEAHKAKGHYLKASKSYSDAVKCCIGSPPGWLLVLAAVNHICAEEFDRAREMLAESLRLQDVDEDEVLLNLSVCERAIGNYEEAGRLANMVVSMKSDLTERATSILISLGCTERGMPRG